MPFSGSSVSDFNPALPRIKVLINDIRSPLAEAGAAKRRHRRGGRQPREGAGRRPYTKISPQVRGP
jgi:hypothetical protein